MKSFFKNINNLIKSKILKFFILFLVFSSNSFFIYSEEAQKNNKKKENHINFSGTYLGIGLGVGYGTDEVKTQTGKKIFNFSNKVEYSFIIGHLIKINNYLYLGAEFDYNLLNNSSGFQYINSNTRETVSTLNHLMNFSIISGVRLFDLPLMPYVSIGAGIARLNYSEANLNSEHQWLKGIKLGIGIQWLISNNIILRIEYINNLFLTNYSVEESVRRNLLDISTIRFGISYKFKI